MIVYEVLPDIDGRLRRLGYMHNGERVTKLRTRLASRDREITLANWTYESRHVQKHQDAIQL